MKQDQPLKVLTKQEYIDHIIHSIAFLTKTKKEKEIIKNSLEDILLHKTAFYNESPAAAIDRWLTAFKENLATHIPDPHGESMFGPTFSLNPVTLAPGQTSEQTINLINFSSSAYNSYNYKEKFLDKLQDLVQYKTLDTVSQRLLFNILREALPIPYHTEEELNDLLQLFLKNNIPFIQAAVSGRDISPSTPVLSSYNYNQKILDKLQTTATYKNLDNERQRIIMQMAQTVLPIPYQTDDECNQLIEIFLTKSLSGLQYMSDKDLKTITTSSTALSTTLGVIAIAQNDIYKVPDCVIAQSIKQFEAQTHNKAENISFNTAATLNAPVDLEKNLIEKISLHRPESHKILIANSNLKCAADFNLSTKTEDKINEK